MLHLPEVLLVATLQQGLAEHEFLQIATQLSVGLQIETVSRPPGALRLLIDAASLAEVGEQLTGKAIAPERVVGAIRPAAAPAPWDSVVDCTVRPCRLVEGVVAVRVDSARFREPAELYDLELFVSIVLPSEDPAKGRGPPCGFHMGVLFSRDETGHWLLDLLRSIDMC